MNKWIIKHRWCVRHCASHLWSLCSSCPGCGGRVIYFLIILCSLFTCTSWVLNPGLLVVNCNELLSESAQQPGFLGNVSNQFLHLFLGLNSLDWLPLEWLDCSSFHLVILALPEMWCHFLHIYTGFFFQMQKGIYYWYDNVTQPNLDPLTHLKVKVKLLSCVRLFVTPWTIAYQAPLPIGFSGQEYWSGLPFPSSGNLSDPGIEPRVLCFAVQML